MGLPSSGNNHHSGLLLAQLRFSPRIWADVVIINDVSVSVRHNRNVNTKLAKQSSGSAEVRYRPHLGEYAFSFVNEPISVKIVSRLKQLQVPIAMQLPRCEDRHRSRRINPYDRAARIVRSIIVIMHRGFVEPLD